MHLTAFKPRKMPGHPSSTWQMHLAHPARCQGTHPAPGYTLQQQRFFWVSWSWGSPACPPPCIVSHLLTLHTYCVAKYKMPCDLTLSPLRGVGLRAGQHAGGVRLGHPVARLLGVLEPDWARVGRWGPAPALLRLRTAIKCVLKSRSHPLPSNRASHARLSPSAKVVG